MEIYEQGGYIHAGGREIIRILYIFIEEYYY
jgi:hypothetical protein